MAGPQACGHKPNAKTAGNRYDVGTKSAQTRRRFAAIVPVGECVPPGGLLDRVRRRASGPAASKLAACREGIRGASRATVSIPAAPDRLPSETGHTD
jgi:hypothetical protein